MEDSPIETSRPLRLVAVAPGPPLSLSTQSGRSHHLFATIAGRGVQVTPVNSREFRPWDALRGAVDMHELVRSVFRGTTRPRVRPEWYWSRRAHQVFWKRFDGRLRALGPHDALLQVGTHVRPSDPELPSYCMTDCTVAQAVEANRFAVSRASKEVVREAIACQREVFDSCSCVFVLSDWAARSVIEDYGVPAERVMVSGTGVNVLERPAREPDVDRPYVLFVGKDWVRKGGPLLLAAFQVARKAVPRLGLKIVGCDPDVRGDGIEVVGRLAKDDPEQKKRLLDLYARASCFSILPDFDPFPNVLLEAQYIGVPVISTDGGSRREAVSDGETGWLLEERDAERIAKVLVAAVRDPERLEAMGAAARHFVEQRFTWPLVVGRMLERMGLTSRPRDTRAPRPDPPPIQRSGDRRERGHARP